MHTKPDQIISRLRRFQTQYFPRLRKQFRTLVNQGQHPTALFIGCSDSRVVPYLIMDSGPGELFIARNVPASASAVKCWGQRSPQLWGWTPWTCSRSPEVF